MPIDRTLAVDVYVIGQGYWDKDHGIQAFQATVTYIQTASNPQIDDLIWFRNGKIDFSGLQADPNFTSNIDITFTLKLFMFDMHGQQVQCVWALPPYPAITITPQDPNMTGTRVSDTTVLLDDNDDNSNTYEYKLGVVLPAFGNYYMELDPQIVNTGLGGQKK